LHTFLTSVMAREEYNCRFSVIIRVGCDKLDALYEQNTPRSIVLLLRLNAHRCIISEYPCESYALFHLTNAAQCGTTSRAQRETRLRPETCAGCHTRVVQCLLDFIKCEAAGSEVVFMPVYPTLKCARRRYCM
jgi:hypothetical protein